MVADPAAVRVRLLSAGAEPGFAGVMTDVRYDRNGELSARDHVFRLRVFRSAAEVRAVIGWKGPVSISPEGLKLRRELEYDLSSASADPAAFPEALGYLPVHTIERFVEYYRLGTTDARLEWYPRMDTLIEIEGDTEGIEAAVRATGIPRAEFTPDALALFSARFTSRTGTRPAMTLAELGADAPVWPPR